MVLLPAAYNRSSKERTRFERTDPSPIPGQYESSGVRGAGTQISLTRRKTLGYTYGEVREPQLILVQKLELAGVQIGKVESRYKPEEAKSIIPPVLLSAAAVFRRCSL